MSIKDLASGALSRITGNMTKADKASGKLSTTMLGVVKKLAPVAIGAAIVGGALFGQIGTAADFQQGISQVGAVSQASAKDMARLETAALSLGEKTAFSAREVTEAEKFLAQAGFTTTQNINALAGTLDLAAAATENLGTTADIASNVMSGFGIDASEMTRIADVMTLTFTTSNTTLAGLGAVMKNVAPVARAAGISLEEVSAVAGVLGNAGIKAERAGTAMKIMLLKLQAPSKAGARALADIGVKAFDSAGNFRSIIDILGDVQVGLKKLPPAARAARLKDVFGEEAIASVNALLGAGVSNLSAFRDRLKRASGTAGTVAKRQLDNFSGSVTIMNSSLEGLSISIGKVFLPVLTDMAKDMTGLVNRFNAFAKTPLGASVTKWTGVVVVGVLALTALAGAIALVTFVTGVLFSPVVLVTAGIIALAAGVIWLWNKWNDLSTTVKIVIGVIGLLAGPIIGVITGIFLLGKGIVWLVNNWDSLVESIKNFNLFEFISSSFNSVVDFFSNLNLFDAGVAFLSTFWEGIKSFFGTLRDGIVNVFSSIRNLLPFSDAKEGPLSALTASGQGFMQAFGAGINLGAPGLRKTVEGALAGVALAANIAIPAPNFPAPAPGPAPVNQAQTSQSTTINITINGLELPQVRNADDFMQALIELTEQNNV